MFKKKFICLKKKFIITGSLKYFILLIKYWTVYINKTIGNFKYNLYYTFQPSITNTIGDIIFQNVITFTKNNEYTNSFNNLNAEDYYNLFNSYNNKTIKFTTPQQKIITKIITTENENWSVLDNLYCRFTPGTIDFIDNTGGVYVVPGAIQYDFLCGYPSYNQCFTQMGETGLYAQTFPTIPKGETTTISSDRNGNLYIFDSSYDNSYTTFMLYYYPNDSGYPYYIWAYIPQANSGNIFCGCTGLYSNSGYSDNYTTYLGSYCTSQYQYADNNKGYILIVTYITTPIVTNGTMIDAGYIDYISTIDNDTIKIQTGMDSAVYSGSDDYSYSNIIATSVDSTTPDLVIISQPLESLATPYTSAEFPTVSGLYGTASVKNGNIYVYTSVNGIIYYCGTSTSPVCPIIPTYASGSEPITGYIATGITNYYDDTASPTISYLYVAYHTTVFSNNGKSFTTYIYRYTVDSYGTLTLNSYITGGLYDAPFYNIGYMTSNIGPDTTYTISCYEYSFGYDVSRILKLPF